MNRRLALRNILAVGIGSFVIPVIDIATPIEHVEHLLSPKIVAPLIPRRGVILYHDEIPLAFSDSFGISLERQITTIIESTDIEDYRKSIPGMCSAALEGNFRFIDNLNPFLGRIHRLSGPGQGAGGRAQ